MNKKTKALTTEQYKEIIQTMREGFSGCRANDRIATALVLDGGREQDAAIFVSCDLTSLPALFAEMSRAKVAKRNSRIPVENIVLNATHTHCGCAIKKTAEKTPDGQNIYPWEQYREFCTDQIADAVCEAWEKRREGGIAYE